MNQTVFCIDFDETLSATDRLRVELAASIRQIGGEALESAYTESYEAVRQEYGAVRIPLVLKKIAEHHEISLETHRQLAELFHAMPYQDFLYPGAEELVVRLKEQGKVIIFSDGDSFFQPQKIYATSIARAADAVIVLIDKTKHFADLEGYYPAERYAFIDDKQRVLDAAKNYFGERCTTVHVRQGRYVEASQVSTADFNVDAVSDVANVLL